MCGIVFKANFGKLKSTPVNNDILQQFDSQRGRGVQGFGIFDGQFMNIVRETREDNILKWLVNKNSNFIMFHHRFPTSTVNVSKAAHPFNTGDYFGDTQYIMVHNGIIRNANELFVEHQERGIQYQSLLQDMTFNDSEALMWDLALTMERQQEDVTAYGDMAFVMVKTVKRKIVDVRYGRNNRPLNIKRNDETLELSSEGDGIPISSNALHVWNYKTHEVTRENMTFPQYKPFQAYNTDSSYVSNKSNTCNQSGFFTDDVRPENFDSYEDWWERKYGNEYDRQYGVVSSSPGAPPLVDPEENWQRLRKKFSQPKLPANASMEGEMITGDNVEEATALILEAEGLDGASSKSIAQILESKSDILETRRDKSGKFIVSEVKHKDVPINIDDLDVRDYGPTAAEVQNCAMDFMVQAHGNFESAYALLEWEYAEFIEEVNGRETFDDIRKQLLFERAMEFINSDPEYENEKSTSSIWEALWMQKQLAIKI